MHYDHEQHRTRRPWLRLLNAVLELAGSGAELLRHGERPWASVTFAGTRHTIALRFSDAAIAAGEALIAALPEHEFEIPGQLVADAAIICVEHELTPTPRLDVEIELLLVEDR